MPARRQRLDAELVRRGLARSRQQASELIEAGRVSVAGLVIRKPASQVEAAAAVVVSEAADDPGYASRGAHKLVGALDAFTQVRVAGRRCLDAGASTGGFTDVLLRRDAREVVAVDVGYGQLAWSLRSDDRVTVIDRQNVRTLSLQQVGEPVSLVVADLSFISLRLVLAPLRDVAAPGADLVLMVKPQFEVGKTRLPSGGVVRNPEHRAGAVLEVATAAISEGLSVLGVTASPLPGPSGNVEYFLWLRTPGDGEPPTEPLTGEALAEAVRAAVQAGPSGAQPSADGEPTAKTDHVAIPGSVPNPESAVIAAPTVAGGSG